MAKALVGGNRAQSEASKERAAALVGRTISDRYRIVELVAMGAIGGVYRAEHLLMRKEVAIKVLHPETEGFPELVARFEREAVAGAHINHPNVAAASDFGKFDDDCRFLVLEYIRGETLRDVIRRGPLPALSAANIARQLAAALGAGHEKGIVHRDVKPLNVMLLENREPGDEIVKLIDFGLAKVPVDRLSTFALDADSADTSLTHAGVVMGTVAYMAPETAMGMRAVQARADLYSLGVIFYEMLAGMHPFEPKEPTILFALHRSQPPPPIATRNPAVRVPEELEAIVMRLLEKDPDARFPDAAAVMVAIDEAVARVSGSALGPDVFSSSPSLPSSPSSPGAVASEIEAAPTSPKREPARGRSALWLLAAVVVAGALAAVVFLRAGAEEARPLTPIATYEVPAKPPAPPTAATSAPIPDAPPSRVQRLLAAAAHRSGSAAAAAVVELARSEPEAFEDRSVQATVALVAVKAAREGGPDGDQLFFALARELGPSGLDVLYDLSVSNEPSRGADRARTLLADPQVMQGASPAMKIAYDLRRAACHERPFLFPRAADEGDDRALAVLTSMQPPACEPHRAPCCFRRHGELEKAVTAIQARLRR